MTPPKPIEVVALATAPLAALAASPWPGSLVGLPIGAAAGIAAWRIWGAQGAWVAAMAAGVAASALRPPLPLMALLSAALLVAAWWPRWGSAAVGAASLAAKPLPLALCALAIGLALSLMPQRLQPLRRGTAELTVRASVWAAVLAFVLASFVLPRWLSFAPGPALGFAALVALAWSSGVAAVAAWRIQDGARLSWSLALLVPLPFVAARLIGAGVAPGLAVMAAAAAVQGPVPLRLATRGAGPRAARVGTAVVALAGAAALALLGWR